MALTVTSNTFGEEPIPGAVLLANYATSGGTIATVSTNQAGLIITSNNLPSGVSASIDGTVMTVSIDGENINNPVDKISFTDRGEIYFYDSGDSASLTGSISIEEICEEEVPEEPEEFPCVPETGTYYVKTYYNYDADKKALQNLLRG